MISAQSPALIILAPLLGSFFSGLIGLYNRRYCFHIVLISMALSFVGTLQTMSTVLKSGPIHYYLSGWMPPFGIEYVVDHLNAMVMVIVAFTGLINIIFTRRNMETYISDKIPQFSTLYLLLMTGLLGITITGDVFNLYVLLEISALTAYALIALGRERAVLASYNYLIVGTIGASLYLLGVGHLYISTGSLNMPDLNVLLASMYSNKAVLVAFILMLVGIWVKMAFFPAHGWLPNAYTYAPASASSLLAPTMTKVSVYVMIRIMFSVFTPDYSFKYLAWQNAIIWCAVIAIIGGALQALAQRDFKRMLTYLIISEVGYMVGGVWLGNRLGITGAILHILNDAMMMLCLFFINGVLRHKFRHTNISGFIGLVRTMPYTMGAFIIAAFSMIGVPPTCGFFSKWYLLLGAIEAGKWHFLIALILSSLVNAVLFFRIIEVAYFTPAHEDHDHHSHHSKINEVHLEMLVPLILVAISLVLIGVFSGEIVTHIIQPAVPAGIGN